MKRVSFTLITGAFITLTVLIAALTASSVYQLSQTQERINTIVAQHNHKIDIITRTQVAAYTHTDRLSRIVLENDPFKRDELYMEFNRAGFLVGSGRVELRQAGLTREEQAKFDKQSALIEKIVPAQAAVIDLANAGKHEAARAYLFEQAVPLQEQFSQSQAELREMLQRANEQAMQEAARAYRNSRLLTLVSGGFATALGMLLGWLTLTGLHASQRRIQQQMAELETSHAALQIEATHDPLTGLANRRLFYDRLGQAMLRAKRYKHRVAVLFVDLDHFKSVNDRYGHHVGDALLKEVASRLIGGVRASDTVARSGGDEFMVILDRLQDRQDCEAIMRVIESSLSGRLLLFGHELKLEASIGHALYPEDGKTEDELVHAADLSMYHAKTGARRMAQ